MIIDLLGVLNDGSAFHARTPRNTRTTLRLVRGATTTLRLSVIYNSGVKVRLDDGTPSAYLTIKAKSSDSTALLTLTGTRATDGQNRYNFDLSAANTALLEPGQYVWDVWLTFNARREPVIPISPLILEPGLRLS